MYGSRPEAESLGNVVLGLHFVVVKRLEALVLGRRVHASRQLKGIAVSGDIFSSDHTHRPGAQRMIPAFAILSH
jgi:hypothetical protein